MLKNSFVNIHSKHMAKSRIRKLYSVLLTSCNESTLSLSGLGSGSGLGQRISNMFEHAHAQQYGHSIAAITM